MCVLVLGVSNKLSVECGSGELQSVSSGMRFGPLSDCSFQHSIRARRRSKGGSSYVECDYCGYMGRLEQALVCTALQGGRRIVGGLGARWVLQPAVLKTADWMASSRKKS
jgi:hypothetical protein